MSALNEALLFLNADGSSRDVVETQGLRRLLLLYPMAEVGLEPCSARRPNQNPDRFRALAGRLRRSLDYLSAFLADI